MFVLFVFLNIFKKFVECGDYIEIYGGFFDLEKFE